MLTSLVRLGSRLVRRLTRPITRPATLFLIWTQRYTIGLWIRSLFAEGRRQTVLRRVDAARSRALLRALWRVSSDPRLANSPELRMLSIDEVGEVIADASHDWHGHYLLDLRVGVTRVAPGHDRPSPTQFSDDPITVGTR